MRFEEGSTIRAIKYALQQETHPEVRSKIHGELLRVLTIAELIITGQDSRIKFQDRTSYKEFGGNKTQTGWAKERKLPEAFYEHAGDD